MQQSSHFNMYQVFTKYYYNMKKMDKKPYPSMSRSIAALYWKGISIRAAKAKSVSFFEGVTTLDIISVKLTNYKQRRHSLKVNACSIIFNLSGTIQRITLNSNLIVYYYCDTWKLSYLRSGILSSKFFMPSQGPSPTPTRTIESG